MDIVLICALALLFLLFVIVDIIGHKLLKIKRSIFGWLFLSILILACGFSGFTGIRGVLAKDDEDSSLYLAYRYLMDGDVSGALSVIDHTAGKSRDQADIIEIMAYCQNEDYLSAYFKSKRIINEGKIEEDLLESVTQLNVISADMLGIQAENMTDEAEEIPETSVTQELSYQEQYDKIKDENKTLLNKEIKKCFKTLDYDDEDKLEELYLLHKNVSSGKFDDLSLHDVKDAIEVYEGDREILKLAVKYAAGIKNYEKAVEFAQELLKNDKSKENYIILTDVIAQGVLDGYSITPEHDEEKEEILDKAESYEKRAAKYNDGDETKARFLNRANELYEQAAQIDIYRAINYLESKKPFLIDSSGLFDVQLAKLYLAADDRDKAKAIIYDLIDDASVISDESPIKEPLEEVIDAYNQSEADQVSPLLKSAVKDLVEAESQDIIAINETTINGKLSNYITSTLKYNKIGVFISKIDTSRYPDIKAYLNVNGEKDGIFGLVSDFEAQDFELIDTQYQIKKFEIDNQKSNTGVNISIVLDCSGSMDGTPLADAKIAAKACIDKMGTKDQEISIVAYSSGASLITPKTDKADTLISGINSLSSGGGTNIPSGIVAGIDSINGSKGKKAMILLTDGQDGNTGEMDAAIESAIKNDISIFAVGLGDVNSDYLLGIAERTGGKYILASNSTELEDIYLTLQKYIVNNYCFEYTVEANPEVDPRNLIVNIPKYQVSGDKDYFISDQSSDNTTVSKDIQKVDENSVVISAVIPNGLSVSDLSKGREITFKGLGFSEGMHVSIGNLSLQNLKMIDGSTASGRFRGSLTAGSYQMKVTLPDGRVAIKDNALYVFRAGTTTRIRIGSTTITADTIGQTGDKSFVAAGNVLINGFIHCSTPLTLTANDLPSDFDISSKDTAYLGNSGVLSGDGKLYISYAQATNGGNFKKTFAKLALGGKDYIVQEGEFAIGIDGTETDFDTSLHNLNIQIPMMSTIEVAKMKLYSDRIQVTVNEVSPLAIIESVADGIKGSVLSTQKEKNAADEAKKVKKRSEAFKFKPLTAIGGSFDVALTADDIEFGLTLSLDSNNSIQFGSIGLNKAELKLSSLDPENEYWKLSGEIDFSKIVKGFGGMGITGLNGHIASYYWCFDEIEITADLYPGIPIYNAVYIDKMGLNLNGASTLILNSSLVSDAVKKVLFADENIKAVKPENIILSGIVGADANLFKTFKLKVPEDFTEWGTLGEIDGKISYNFSDAQFSVTADLKLLKQKLANASIGIGKKGLDMKAGLQANLSFLDCELGGKYQIGLNSTWTVFTYTMGIDGHLDCGFMNVHYKGDCGLKFIAEYDCSYFAVELSQGHVVSKYWYDSDGQPFIWNRFHAQTYFE